MQAVILAGGAGTRLGPLTEQTPKPLLAVGDRPFLEWLLLNLERYHFDSVIVLAGYHGNTTRSFVENRRSRLPVSVLVEPEPQGTGGAILQARELLEPEFLLLNGDSIFDFNYLDLIVRMPGDCLLGMGLREVADATRYGIVTLEGDHVREFREKHATGPGLVNGGVYVVRRKLLDRLRPGCSLENDILPGLPRGAAVGFSYRGLFIDIGVPSDLELAQTTVPHHFRKPAVFFDRDGTLNRDTGYVHRPDDFEWLPGAREAIKLANDLGYLAIVVTNQAGVARGYYLEEDVHSLHAWMNRELRPLGAHIDAFYYCPHHPSEGNAPYREECACRKPGTGLIDEAAREWNVALTQSIGVGDKESDIVAYRSAGVGRTYTSLTALLSALCSTSTTACGRPALQHQAVR